MHFKYVRIQGRELASNTNYAQGIFSICWGMVQNDVMEAEDSDLFKEIDLWFSEELPYPPQCMNCEPVVCFFNIIYKTPLRKQRCFLCMKLFYKQLDDLVCGLGALERQHRRIIRGAGKRYLASVVQELGVFDRLRKPF